MALLQFKDTKNNSSMVGADPFIVFSESFRKLEI